MKPFKVFWFLLLLFSTGASGYAQCVPATIAAGALDTCFGTGGKVTTDITPQSDYATGVVVQPDGKIVAAGVAGEIPNTSTRDFAVVRYNVDGSLDTTFGGGDGIVITDVGFGTNDTDHLNCLALQPDGKIVVAGGANVDDRHQGIFILRYNANGSLDTSFGGGDGMVFHWTGDGFFFSWMIPSSMVIQDDGTIVVGGAWSYLNGDRNHSLLLVYNTDGALVNDFGENGFDVVHRLALYGDRIIILGSQNPPYGVPTILRLNPNGTSEMRTTYSPYGIGGGSLLVRSDGNIFFAYNFYIQATQTWNVRFMRLNSSGAIAADSVYPNDSYFGSLAFQPDAKVVSGGGGINPGWGFTIRRFTDANILDTSFNGGRVDVRFLPPTTEESASVAGIAVTRDAKIVAAGTTGPQTNPATTRGDVFAVTRLMSGLAPRPTAFDFDGDEKADISVYRASNRRWYIFRSSDSGVTVREFGEGSYKPAPADFDGDRKTDIALFYQGNWTFLSSISGATNSFTQFPASDDIPRPADFNGDGMIDGGMYSPSTGNWRRANLYNTLSSNGQWGVNGDLPLTGDFDGDGNSDLAIFRPSTGDWWWKSSVDGSGRRFHWGISADKPVPADYDGDGKTDFAVYRPSTGTWYIFNSSNFSITIKSFGLSEDKPVAADYDGDRKADIAVFRPSTGTWYLLRSTAGLMQMQFGLSTDVPLPNVYVQ